jgi:Membrane-associated sensor, integral membrane domain
MRKAPDERASPLVPDEQASARLTIAGVTLIIGEASDESALLLATIPPTPPQRRLALALGAGLIVLFGVAAPIAAMPLPQLYAIIPIIVAIFFLSDLITAALLFSQFSVIRSHALLSLANGYLFTALIGIPIALTYPGLFSPTGLLGAGLQTAGWLYLSYHFCFISAVLGYAYLKDRATAVAYI